MERFSLKSSNNKSTNFNKTKILIKFFYLFLPNSIDRIIALCIFIVHHIKSNVAL